MKTFALLTAIIICLLQLFYCSSLKRGREEYDDKQNLTSEKRQKIGPSEQGLSKDYLFLHIIQYSPQLQASIRMTGPQWKRSIDYYRPYQNLLSSRLNLPAFTQLPLHNDLQVFETVAFPRTPMGKAASLIFVFKMTQYVLTFSALRDQINEIVYNEAVHLADSNMDAFLFFGAATDFLTSSSRVSIIKHFLKANNFKALLSLQRGYPAFFNDFNLILRSLSYKECNSVLIALGQHLNKNLDDLDVFFPDQFSDSMVLSLLCTEIPFEQINDLLTNAIFSTNLTQFSLTIRAILVHSSFMSLPRQESLDVLLLQILNHAADIYLIPNHFPDLRVFIQVRFGFKLDEANPLLNDQKLLMELCDILISSRKYEEALKYLPSKPALSFINFIISESSDFCSVLRERKAGWVQRHFYFNYSDICKQPSLILACHGLRRISEFYSFATHDQLVGFSEWMLYNGRAAEVDEFLSSIPLKTLFSVYGRFARSKITGLRFIGILSIFQRLFDLNSRPKFEKELLTVYPSPEQFISILEIGGEAFIVALKNRPFNVDYRFNGELLTKILRSEELRRKLLAFKPLVMKYFYNREELMQQSFQVRSPSEIFYLRQFLDFDGDYLIKLLLLENSSQLSRLSISFTGYFFNLIALSRAWKNFDSSIASYSDDDFCAATLSRSNDNYGEFLSCLYSLFTESGKRMLMAGFSEAEDINDAMNFEPQIESEFLDEFTTEVNGFKRDCEVFVKSV